MDPEKSSLNFPDFIVFDLDPYTDSGSFENSNRKEPKYTINGFKATVDVALDLKQLLDDLNIKSYVKTSGKTGLHVFIPIDNFYTYKQLRTFAKLIGTSMNRMYPNKLTMEWSISKRCGKVFLDDNQNIRAKTLASIFSPRPIESATVSFPVEWEVLSQVHPTDFTILNVPEILQKHSTHAWMAMMENKQNLTNLLNKA